VGDLLSFRKPRASDKHRGKSLCRHGFHKWQPVAGTPFDTKQGKLVTRLRCSRCGATRTQAR
jgi:hypothetical protein